MSINKIIAKEFQWKSNNHKLISEVFGKSSGHSADEVFREFISNSIDADASKIEIEIYKTIINGIDKIIIRDDGVGMSEVTINNGFSEIATSYKKINKSKNKNIGNFGVGRFSFFSIASSSIWKTISKDKGDFLEIEFKVNQENTAIEKVPYTITAKDKKSCPSTGTKIELSNILPNVYSSICDTNHIVSKLTSTFASVIISNKWNVEIFIKLFEHNKNNQWIETKNEKLDFTKEIYSKEQEDFRCSNGIGGKIDHLIFHNDVKLASDAQAYYSHNGVCFKQDVINSKIYNYKYIALIDSSEFGEFMGTSRDDKVSGLYPKFNTFKNEVQEHCKRYIKNKNAELQIPFIQIARAKTFYPERFKKTELDVLENANKLIYDKTLILLEEKLKIHNQSEKIQNLIFTIVEKSLADNNFLDLLHKVLDLLHKVLDLLHKVLDLLHKVLDLNENEVQKFSDMLFELKFDKLSALYESTVGRLKFLNSFESIVYPEHNEHKRTIKERTQLQPLLEKNLWLFKEEYNMAVCDRRISTILDKLEISTVSDNVNEESISKDGLNLIPDFFISSRRYNDLNEQDNFLVIEIKRPIIKLNRTHEDQVMKYIDVLIEREQFKDANWQFMLVSAEIDSQYKKKISTDGRIGLERTYYGNKGVELKVLTWSDLINARKREYNFIVESIKKEFKYDPAYIQDKYPELLLVN